MGHVFDIVVEQISNYDEELNFIVIDEEPLNDVEVLKERGLKFI